MIFELVDFCLNALNGPFYESRGILKLCHNDPGKVQIFATILVSTYITLVGINTYGISFIFLQTIILYNLLYGFTEFIHNLLREASRKYLNFNASKNHRIYNGPTDNARIVACTNNISISSPCDRDPMDGKLKIEGSLFFNFEVIVHAIAALFCSLILYKMYKLSRNRKVVMVGRFIYALTTVIAKAILTKIIGSSFMDKDRLDACIAIFDLILTKIAFKLCHHMIKTHDKVFSIGVFAFGGIFYLLYFSYSLSLPYTYFFIPRYLLFDPTLILNDWNVIKSYFILVVLIAISSITQYWMYILIQPRETSFHFSEKSNQ